MPSFGFTPGALVLAGGTINPEPVRFSFSPAALRLNGAALTIGPNLSSGVTDAISALLDTLFASESIVDQQGRPTRRFQQIWQNTIQGIKDILTSQGLSISELQSIYAGINAAQSTATAAVQQAQQTETARNLTDSYPDPPGVLRASSDGTVTIAAHQRVYGDGTRVSVDAGSVTGFSPGDYVSVFYDDSASAGGIVNYRGTTNAVAQSGNRHVVGQATIPAVGEPASSGTSVSAPGYTPPPAYPDRYEP